MGGKPLGQRLGIDGQRIGQIHVWVQMLAGVMVLRIARCDLFRNLQVNMGSAKHQGNKEMKG